MESRGPGEDVQNKFEGKSHSGDKVMTPRSWKSGSEMAFPIINDRSFIREISKKSGCELDFQLPGVVTL